MSTFSPLGRSAHSCIIPPAVYLSSYKMKSFLFKKVTSSICTSTVIIKAKYDALYVSHGSNNAARSYD